MKAELAQLSNSLEAILSRRGVLLIRGDRVFRINPLELARLFEAEARRTEPTEESE